MSVQLKEGGCRKTDGVALSTLILSPIPRISRFSWSQSDDTQNNDCPPQRHCRTFVRSTKHNRKRDSFFTHIISISLSDKNNSKEIRNIFPSDAEWNWWNFWNECVVTHYLWETASTGSNENLLEHQPGAFTSHTRTYARAHIRAHAYGEAYILPRSREVHFTAWLSTFFCWENMGKILLVKWRCRHYSCCRCCKCHFCCCCRCCNCVHRRWSLLLLLLSTNCAQRWIMQNLFSLC